MKIAAIALVLCFGLAGCQFFADPHGPNPGNPDSAAYAGDPGSVYDRAANPPSNIGRASYDPNAPLPASLPASQALQPTVTGAPLPPPPPMR